MGLFFRPFLHSPVHPHMTAPTESLQLRGILKGHGGWVTSIATTSENPDSLLTGSRDKTLILWTLTRGEGSDYGQPKKVLKGHSHFVSDITISSDGQFALSGSWDGTLRLWDLNKGETTRRFVGHTKEVLSVAFSPENRQIISGSRDRTLRLWNTLGECKFVIEEQGHTEWVSCVRFSPNTANPLIVSAGWDKLLKVWHLSNCKLRTNLVGHTAFINSVIVSPDGSLCASGGKDGNAMVWDLNEGSFLYSLPAGGVINALEFSPSKYWLCAATDNSIRIWDLEAKQPVCDLTDFTPAASYGKRKPPCTSLAWSADGRTLYAGYADHIIRVWEVRD